MTAETPTDSGAMRVSIHLGSGTELAALLDDIPADMEPHELAEHILGELHSLDRPRFIRFDNVIVHTQAISGLHFDLV